MTWQRPGLSFCLVFSLKASLLCLSLSLSLLVHLCLFRKQCIAQLCNGVDCPTSNDLIYLNLQQRNSIKHVRFAEAWTYAQHI